jgi:hypothetical protein
VKVSRHAILWVIVIVGLSGCVRSQSSRYQRTISSSVPPDRSASADVAREFALTSGDQPAFRMGAAND